MSSIAAAFGVGSGIDTRKLVADLVSATREPRQAQIAGRANANSAKLSALGRMSSGLAVLADGTADRARTVTDTELGAYANDLITAINALRDEVTGSTRASSATANAGPLASDASARQVSRELSALAGRQTTASGAFTRLTDIGISTGRDGKLNVDQVKLQAAITTDPTSVKALLGVGPTGGGILTTLDAMRDRLVGPNGGLATAKLRYERVAKTLDRDFEKLTTDVARMTDRLTLSFSGMDQRVASLKASQAYIAQQVAVWTSQR